MVGTDVSAVVVAEARRHLVGSDVRVAQADGRALPWTDGAFDVVTCCLALHHFSPADAVQVLQEMWRVASSAVIVTDLTRSYAAYIGTWLATRTVVSNLVTRHDGPLSVLRAYTPAEMRELAAAATISPVTAHVYPLFRQVLIGWKGDRAVYE
jgi:ubiquinone/menaquinone biosynthesis C-methylase UbiE